MKKLLRLKYLQNGVVDERHIPDPPTNVSVSKEEVDKRIGFFGHVILTIIWNGPQSNSVIQGLNCKLITIVHPWLSLDNAYLENFNITVTPAMNLNKARCGDEAWSTNVLNVSILKCIQQ